MKTLIIIGLLLVIGYLVLKPKTNEVIQSILKYKQ